MDDNLSSYKYDLTDVKNVSRKRHDLMEKIVQSSKESVKFKVMELRDFMVKEVNKIDGFYAGVKKNVDALLYATVTLTEDIQVFNLEYNEELSTKNESDTKVLKGIKTSLSSY